MRCRAAACRQATANWKNVTHLARRRAGSAGSRPVRTNDQALGLSKGDGPTRIAHRMSGSFVVRRSSSVVRGPWSVVRGPWSVIRDPWSVVRGPSSVVHRPRSKVQSPKSIIGPRSKVHNRSKVQSPSNARTIPNVAPPPLACHYRRLRRLTHRQRRPLSHDHKIVPHHRRPWPPV
jgi:hypothetical protein